MTPLRFVFVLDTPNVWFGRALAGTPARVLALAEYAQRAGAQVTVVLCDRGAEYGAGLDWATRTLLVHPADFYEPSTLGRILAPTCADFLVVCEAESLLALGRSVADRVGARLVYDVHDGEAALAESLGEPRWVIERHAMTQRMALAAADHVIVLTPREAGMVASVGIAAALLPNGSDPALRTCWGPDPSAATLVFLGNLYYTPNARAVDYLRDKLLPSLRELAVRVRIRVIGRGPGVGNLNNGMVHLGQVPSINDALQGATLAVAPLEAGSGAKMKVLDYMAAGLPVLGTTEAVSGLPDDHPGAIVEDALTVWPNLVRALLRDPDTLQALGRQGRACVEDQFSWRRIGASLVDQGRIWLNQGDCECRDIPQPLVGFPRWLAEHATQDALGEPRWTVPGRPIWLNTSFSLGGCLPAAEESSS
jgi:glycosyltransferase involved in cell wall biosynthesis